MRTPRVSVIGSGDCDASVYRQATELGRGLAGLGVAVVCGGLGGVMEAVCRGAEAGGGTTIGILPGDDRAAANAWVTVPVATGLGHARNALVVMNGDVVVAVHGAAGTLSELGFAAAFGTPVVGLGCRPLEFVAMADDVPGALALVRTRLRELGFEV